MHYIIDTTTETCTITCTGQDLVKMESLDLFIYATPTPEGLANQLYLRSQPRYRDDFFIADSHDFIEEIGVDTLDWQDKSQEELEALEEEIGEITIMVSRTKRFKEPEDD